MSAHGILSCEQAERSRQTALVRVRELEAALRRAASAAGHPDAAEGCRRVIAISDAALAASPAGGAEGDTQ